MKRNIFDIVNSQKMPLLEVQRIDTLIKKSIGVYVADEPFSILSKGTPVSVIKYVDDKLFMTWKRRGTCINCKDFERTIGIDVLPQADTELSNDFILYYCEYAANMLFLLKEKIAAEDKITDAIPAAEENIKRFLGWYNYELKYFPEREQVLVTAKNAAATVVAESVDNQSLAYCIVEYNHHLLKGNVERKKEILLTMGADLEPRRKEIEEMNKALASRTFFLLNNMDIRHNNRTKGDKNYVEKVARMKKGTLEKWYDKTYQLMLTAYMVLNSKEVLKDAEVLTSQIKASGQEIRENGGV